MLTYLAQYSEINIFFNLFRYLTFRSGGAFITALMICFVIGGPLIRWLNKKQRGINNIREDVPEQHFKKIGTPTMGGLMILLSVTISTLLWSDLHNHYIWMILVLTIGFGLIGFADDYMKMKGKRKGVPGRIRLLYEASLAIIVCVWLAFVTDNTLANQLALPFFKDLLIDLGWFYVIFAGFVIVGTANAVNLTDGLDGLAIGPAIIATCCFGMIVYLVGNAVYAVYLGVPYIANVGELAVFCAGLMGASLGFLWFNAPPAKIFMGDTGSLAIGSALGGIAVLSKHEIVLMIIGGLFVLETVSVIIQVISFKLVGKRIFAMAPLHHHFEKKGWHESTIVVRFWIIAVIMGFIGLATLKLR